MSSGVGCGGSGSGSATAGDDQDVTKGGTPIPEVLQYMGKFDDPSHTFGAVELLRDGTYRRFDPHLGVTTGHYTGPSKPESTGVGQMKLRLDKLAATVGPDRSFSRALLVVAQADGTHVTLTSEYPLAGEAACDATGGHFTDDDPDPASGLFCVCNAPQVFLHAAGGCIDPTMELSAAGGQCGDDVAIRKRCEAGLKCVFPQGAPISEHTAGTCQ